MFKVTEKVQKDRPELKVCYYFTFHQIAYVEVQHVKEKIHKIKVYLKNEMVHEILQNEQEQFLEDYNSAEQKESIIDMPVGLDEMEQRAIDRNLEYGGNN